VFIETNIRTVFLFHFFPSKNRVRDKEILPLVEETLDRGSPREWYSALMDYGVFLKAAHVNPSRRSAHFTRQSRFEGSDRQVRGRVVRLLVAQGVLSEDQLMTELAADRERVRSILDDLTNEGFLSRTEDRFTLR
jgi:A/G-specific adenine glycosylase